MSFGWFPFGWHGIARPQYQGVGSSDNFLGVPQLRVDPMYASTHLFSRRLNPDGLKRNGSYEFHLDVGYMFVGFNLSHRGVAQQRAWRAAVLSVWAPGATSELGRFESVRVDRIEESRMFHAANLRPPR